MKKGIDISKWQGTIDFNKVKTSGIEFVITRSSYRQTVDPKFFEYVKGCNEVGLPILGVYHFIYAMNDAQALNEAKFCVKQVKEAGLPAGTYIFSDFEYDTITNAGAANVLLTKKDCNNFTRIFCEYVESQGFKAGIYANIDFYKNWYDKALLNKYYFWLADYNGEPDYECFIQQFTSSGQVNGIKGKVDMNYLYGSVLETPSVKLERSRQAVVDLALSWEGKKESDGSFKSIVDTYNSYRGKLPRGVKMVYSWPWCACTWSAQAIKLGYTDIIPIEISCGYLIEEAKKICCWQEDDSYIAKPGDGILYDWQDKGSGDNTGWPDHVGTIVETHEDAGYYVVEEGNYNNSVKKRTISINGIGIRGFITPKYNDNSVIPPAQMAGKDLTTIAHEVIAGVWKNNPERKAALEREGYDYEAVRRLVNQILNGSAATPNTPTENAVEEVKATCYAREFEAELTGIYKTTANLYLRNDAGTNKKALCVIPNNTAVECFGYYNVFNNVKWLYIQVTLDNIKYTGFSSSKYLSK